MLAETFSMTGWKYLRLQCFLIFNVSFGLKKIHLLSCLSLKILFYWREKKKMYFFKAYKSSKLLFVIITVTKERQELLTWDNYLFFPHSLCDPSSFLCQFPAYLWSLSFLLISFVSLKLSPSCSQSFLGPLPCSSLPWPRWREWIWGAACSFSQHGDFSSPSAINRDRDSNDGNAMAVVKRDRILPGQPPDHLADFLKI